jgi:hypothetical protein
MVMRALAVIGARPGRIDYLKIAAVSGALIGSWGIVYGIGRTLFALIG